MYYIYLLKNKKRALNILQENKNKWGQKGAALYLSLMIMTILLAMALGVGAILFAQIRMLRGMGDSAIALAAADTGIERVLMDRRDPSDILASPPLPNGATYQVFVTMGRTIACAAPNFCIRSIGTYQRTRRAIEISY